MNSDIDRHFIEQMIPYHQMAIMMASMLLSRTEREEMKRLAKILSGQNRRNQSDETMVW